MNVLIVTVLAANSPSGVVTYYNTLAQDLKEQGMEVRILDSSDTPFLWRKVLGVLFRVMPVFGNRGRVLYYEFAQFTSTYLTIRAQKMAKPDLVHAQDTKSAAAAVKAFSGKVPVIMTCHFNDNPADEIIDRYALKPWFAAQLTRWYKYLFSHVKNYVFTSNYVYTKSKHLLPAHVTKIVIHNTVNTEFAINRENCDLSDKLIISNVGYIDERKNQKLLIQIGAELCRKGMTNFNIWLIGDGPKRAEYEQLVKQLNLTNQVKFYGQQADPWRLVAQTDLYVHTSLNDNCPYSIIEAFAVNTPVLALPVGGIPEMVPGTFGLLQGLDPNLLADQVAGYFSKDKRAQLMKAQAEYAALKFDHQKSLSELITFYQQTEQAA